MNYKPDFLIKPYEVHACEGLRPTDSDVYAVVYWFEKMRGEKCTAGNDTIAEVARLQVRTVRAALDRLERHGFIQRLYSDKKRTMRTEIKTLVHMTREASVPVSRATRQKKAPKETAIVPATETVPQEPTPGEIARDFFAPKGTMTVHRDRIIEEVAQAGGVTKEQILPEVHKFYLYWTEPTKSGKKQLWETKPTFEVKRRLYTWLSRAGKYNTGGKKGGSGAGATI